MSEQLDAIMAMFSSLNTAAQKAGGTVYEWEALKKMTVAELITTLGPNFVRFQCILAPEPSVMKNMLCRLAEKVKRANDIQHSGGKIQPEDWSELYQLTNEAFALLQGETRQ